MLRSCAEARVVAVAQRVHTRASERAMGKGKLLLRRCEKYSGAKSRVATRGLVVCDFRHATSTGDNAERIGDEGRAAGFEGVGHVGGDCFGGVEVLGWVEGLGLGGGLGLRSAH